MLPIRSDRVKARVAAIALSPFQNASSRLTLVFRPPRQIERLMTGDFTRPPFVVAHAEFMANGAPIGMSRQKNDSVAKITQGDCPNGSFPSISQQCSPSMMTRADRPLSSRLDTSPSRPIVWHALRRRLARVAWRPLLGRGAYRHRPARAGRSVKEGTASFCLRRFLEDGQAAVAHHLQIDKDRPDAQGCSRPRRSPDTGKPSHDHWVSRLDADRVATGHEAPYVVCQWAIHSGLSAGLKRHASMKPAAADRA